MAKTGPEATEIDPVTLRARPVDAAAMRKRAEALAAQSAWEADESQAARLASHAAILFVVAGSLDRARPLFDFALARQDAERQVHGRTITEIRLAQWFHYAGRFTPARAQLETLVERCRTSPAARPLLDFALQHLGKVLYEAGDCAAALVPLREALQIRRAGGATDLVASTELAVSVVTRALAETSMQGAGGEP